MHSPNYLHPIQNKLAKCALILLLLIHLAGGIGLSLEVSRPYFQMLTPFSLWTTGLLLLLFQEGKNRTFWFFAIIAFLVGFFVEVLGVQTGMIFGEYAYGKTLGLKIWGVPLTIGLNWLILVMASGALADLLPLGKITKAIAGAALMVGLDFLMEPPAIFLDFWTWESEVIPLQNYFGWLLTAFFLHLLWQLMPIKKGNFLSVPIFVIQALFFLALNFSL